MALPKTLALLKYHRWRCQKPWHCQKRQHCQTAYVGTAESVALPNTLAPPNCHRWHCQSRSAANNVNTAKLLTEALPYPWHIRGTAESVTLPNCHPWYCQMCGTPKNFGTAKLPTVALPNPWHCQKLSHCQTVDGGTVKSVGLPRCLTDLFQVHNLRVQARVQVHIVRVRVQVQVLYSQVQVQVPVAQVQVQVPKAQVQITNSCPLLLETQHWAM